MSATNKQVRKEAELEKARREKEHREFKEAQVRRRRYAERILDAVV